LPPQPGQGLPVEDVRFVQRAARLSEVQVDAGKVAAEKATTADVRALAAAIVNENTTLASRLEVLARTRGINLRDPKGGAVTDLSLAGLHQAGGEDIDRRFIARQLGLYRLLADTYQTEASNSPDVELSRVAIVALAALRSQFETARRIGGRYGLDVGTVEAPPQY
jgi:putative membrane protein